MALVWMDGFDQYDNNDDNFDRLYTRIGTLATLSSINPRTGVSCLRWPGSLSNNARRSAVRGVTSGHEYGVGFAARLDGLVTHTNRLYLAEFSSDNGRRAGGVHINQLGQVQLINGGPGNAAGSTVIATLPDFIMPLDAYVHFEVYCRVYDDNGWRTHLILHINGNEVLEVDEPQLVVSGGTAQNISAIAFDTVGVNQCIDDIFIWDTSGTENNTFLGPKRVITLIPDADTAVTGWTGDYQDIQVDDGDTSYINAGTSTPITSEFELEDLPSGVSGISAVRTIFVARTDDDGDAEVQASLLTGSTVATGSDKFIDVNYIDYFDTHELNPDTSLPWTVSQINNAKLRLRRTS